jgi:membrane protease YdiL (CAAX protease family)
VSSVGDKAAELPAPAERFDPRALAYALGVSTAVTAIVTVVSRVMTDRFVAIGVAVVFLVATWAFVWRGDDAHVERSGLALGGLVLPGRLDHARLLRSTGRALAWAAVLSAIAFVPFFFGWRMFWHPRGTFTFHVPWMQALNEIAGQIVIIALPEEAFYRGYLQSTLDRALPFRVRVFGADVGPAILVTSIVFAIGHFATIPEPTRLAVFFPSLLFGWLRARTRGIGAPVAFHAACNVFSEILGKGYRVY